MVAAVQEPVGADEGEKGRDQTGQGGAGEVVVEAAELLDGVGRPGARRHEHLHEAVDAVRQDRQGPAAVRHDDLDVLVAVKGAGHE